MQCTWLTVPPSYFTRNRHGTFKLREIKDPATGTKAQYRRTLIINPGGPAGSGYSLVAQETVDDPSLDAAHDFVAFVRLVGAHRVARSLKGSVRLRGPPQIEKDTRHSRSTTSW